MKSLACSFAWLSLLAIVAHCGDSAATDCQSTGSSCDAGMSCVWTSDEQRQCLPSCAGGDDCAEGELCAPFQFIDDLVEVQRGCLPIDLLRLPASQAEQEALIADCRSRSLETCHRNPLCSFEIASALDLEAQCSRPEAVGCLALGTLCTLSIFVAENAAGELFVFAAGCGNPDFTAINLSLDDPLFLLLFEGETSVYEWPRCD